MVSEEVLWQRSVDRVMTRFRRNIGIIEKAISTEGRHTVLSLFGVKRVFVDQQFDGGFEYDGEVQELRLGLSGLDLIFEAGQARGFDGLSVQAFRDLAVSLYLFHEWHHVSQGLARFADVQALKRTAGYDKLGEMDTVADTVAAQIFACVEAASESEGRVYYAAGFLAALRFMMRFCFPAFGFPLSSRHKAQRALGIAMMAVATERAIYSGQLTNGFDAPLYPYLSNDYSEVVVLTYGQQISQEVNMVNGHLNPEAVKELLSSVDSGNVDELLARTRSLA